MLKRDLYYERIPTKSLRDDVRFLGNILGKVIKEQEGQKFYDLVEKIFKYFFYENILKFFILFQIFIKI